MAYAAADFGEDDRHLHLSEEENEYSASSADEDEKPTAPNGAVVAKERETTHGDAVVENPDDDYGDEGDDEDQISPATRYKLAPHLLREKEFKEAERKAAEDAGFDPNGSCL